MDPADSSSMSVVMIRVALNEILRNEGNHAVCKMLVNNFHKTSYQYDKFDPGGEGITLYKFVSEASRSAKTHANNSRRRAKLKNKKVDKQGTSEASEVPIAITPIIPSELRVDRSLIDGIDYLPYSETMEIFNLDDNKEVLSKIYIDVHHNSDNTTYSIVNQPDAINCLRKLDIHLIQNIIQNKMINLQFNEFEQRAIQGIRHCRNLLVHDQLSPEVEKLLRLGKMLKESISFLQPEMREHICALIDACFCKDIDELRQELLSSVPQFDLIERTFKLLDPNGTVPDCSYDKVCNWLCNRLTMTCPKLHICGHVCSGRTASLFNIYRHWAQPNSELNKRFTLLLPIIRRKELISLQMLNVTSASSLQQDTNIEDRIKLCLEEWAPNTCHVYGVEKLLNLIKKIEKTSILALVDQYDGHFVYTSSWLGLSVETSSSVTCDSGADQSIVKPVVAQLLPLSTASIEKFIQLHDNNNYNFSHYKNFRHYLLLRNPLNLVVFKSVISEPVRRIELTVLKTIVEIGDTWVRRKTKVSISNTCDHNCAENNFQRLAFEHILTGDRCYTVKCNVANALCAQMPTPPYLVGPEEGPLQFQANCLEDLMAAYHVIDSKHIAAWDWLRKVKSFNKVFLFVIQILVEKNEIESHRNLLLNFLTVYLELYIPKRAGTLHHSRPQTCTLEDEHFVRCSEGGGIFKKCQFLTEVDDICTGEATVKNIIVEVLCKFTIWSLDWEQITEHGCRFYKNIFKKIKLEHNKKLVVCNLRDLKLSGPVSKHLNFQWAAELLQLLPELQCSIQVTAYYNKKDPYFMLDSSLSQHLLFALSVLGATSLGPIVRYTGPFFLHHVGLSQSASFSKLSRLDITIYERASLISVLECCPSQLCFLNLNVDLTVRQLQQQTHLAPTKTTANVPRTCIVCFAVRYSGNLQILSAFAGIPHIHVLRLHGVFLPEEPESLGRKTGADLVNKDICAKLNVHCLSVKFVQTYNKYEEEQMLNQWFHDFLYNLATSFPKLKSLVIARLPLVKCQSHNLAELLKKITEKISFLKKVSIRDTLVSLESASVILYSIQGTRCLTTESNLQKEFEDTSPPKKTVSLQNYPLRRRLASGLRDEISNRQTIEQFELSFIDVYDSIIHDESASISSQADTFSSAPHNSLAAVSSAALIEPCMLNLVQQVYHCSVDSFCYQGHTKCYLKASSESFDVNPKRTVTKIHRVVENPVEVLISLTRDLRLHMDLLYLNDKMAKDMLECSSNSNITSDRCNSVLQCLCPAQYLQLRCQGLTSTGLVHLAQSITRQKAARMAADAEPDSWSLSVKSALSAADMKEVSVRRGGVQQWCRDQCRELEITLPYMTTIGYLVFNVVQSKDQSVDLFYVRKSHKGKIFHTFCDDRTRRRFPDSQ